MIEEIKKNIFHVSKCNSRGELLYDEIFCMTPPDNSNLPIPTCFCIGKCQWKNNYCALFGSGNYPAMGKLSIELVTEGEFTVTSGGVKHIAKAGDIFILLPKRPLSVSAAKGVSCKYNLVLTGKMMLMQFLTAELSQYPCVIHNIPIENTRPVFRELYDLYTEEKENFQSKSVKACTDILFQLFQLFQAENTVSYPQNLTKVLKYMEETFPDCGTREEIASACGISVTTLNRLFREYLHTTIGKYRAALRLEYARNLLEQKDLSIKMIAAECGFNSPAFFCREYKRAYGLSPASSRKIKTPEDRIKLLPGGSIG